MDTSISRKADIAPAEDHARDFAIIRAAIDSAGDTLTPAEAWDLIEGVVLGRWRAVRGMEP